MFECHSDEISEGIPISKNTEATGNIAILADFELQETVKAFADKAGDNRILNSVLYLQNKRAPREVTLVTKDINMRLRAKGAGVRFVDDYRTDQLIDDVQYILPKAFSKPREVLEQYSRSQKARVSRVTPITLDRDPFEPTYINQYIIDQESDFAGRVESISETITIRDLQPRAHDESENMGYYPQEYLPRYGTRARFARPGR